MVSITVGFLKGGGSRTTTSVNLALACALRFPDEKILLADADPKNSSSLGWYRRARKTGSGWPENIDVRAIPKDFITDELTEIGETGEYQHLIIDTGNDGETLADSLAFTDHLVIPLTPSTMEFPQIKPTLKIALPYATEEGLIVSALITRIPPQSNLGDYLQEQLSGEGLDVLPTKIKYLTKFLQQSGTGRTSQKQIEPYDKVLADIIAKETAK